MCVFSWGDGFTPFAIKDILAVRELFGLFVSGFLLLPLLFWFGGRGDVCSFVLFEGFAASNR